MPAVVLLTLPSLRLAPLVSVSAQAADDSLVSIYLDDAPVNTLGGASTESGDFTVFGAGAGIRAGRWSLDMRVSNLTD